MRTNFPETWRYLKAQRARNPREDAIEEFTDYLTLGLGEPGATKGAANPPPGQEPEAPAKAAASTKGETRDEYVNRRCEEYMHKNLSSRRGAGGKFYTIGGGGDGGVAFQVI